VRKTNPAADRPVRRADGGNLSVQFHQPLTFLNPAGAGIAPTGRRGAQRVPLAQRQQGVGKLPLSLQGMSKIAMSLGILGF